MREVLEPPLVVLADIAVAPLIAINHPALAGQIREIEPVVTAADHLLSPPPLVVPGAVRGEVHDADFRAAGMRLVVASELLPQIALAAAVPVGVAHQRFRPMAERLQHLAHASLVVKAHDDEASSRALRPLFKRRRVAPEGIWAAHDGFVVAGIRHRKQPELIHRPGIYLVHHVEVAQ